MAHITNMRQKNQGNIFCHLLGGFPGIPKQLQNLGLGKRESFRNASIVNDLILEIWGHLRSANFGALAPRWVCPEVT